MFEHNIDPVFLDFGPLKIYYYGLVYALTFLCIYIFLRYISRKKLVKLKESHVEDLLIYLTLSTILGGRLFYFIFYNPMFLLQNPLEFFMLWHGGMSFHGGLIGIVLGVWLFAKRFRYSFYKLADILTLPFAIALFFGRIANFINGELFGRITDVPWAVKFPGVEGYRHPSQIYEAFKNLAIFGLEFFLLKKKKPDGVMFWTFVTAYGVLRFIIEFFRQPDVQIGNDGFFFGWMTMGQILCTFMIMIGSYFLIKINYEDKFKKYSE